MSRLKSVSHRLTANPAMSGGTLRSPLGHENAKGNLKATYRHYLTFGGGALIFSRSLELDPKYTCLLVIDVQNDHCHEQGTFSQMGIPLETIQQSVRRLIPFIEDARQAGVMVIFIRNQHSEWDDSPTRLTRRGRRGAEKIIPVCVVCRDSA